VPNLRIHGVEWSAQRIPTTVNLDFLDSEEEDEEQEEEKKEEEEKKRKEWM
jgi:hypothetical protein